MNDQQRNCERTLIDACLRGDSQAFEGLYRRYSRDVYSLAFRMLRSQADAEEVTQETFLSAYRSLNRFRFDSAFSTWLYRIAMRRITDWLRKHSKRRAATVSGESDYVFETLPDPHQDGNPRERAAQEEQQKRLEALISLLDERHRMILLLRYIHEQSYEEIAQILGCRLGTVKSRLNRAHAMLQQVMEEHPTQFQ